MRHYEFGKASKYAMNNTIPEKRKDDGADSCKWLFSGYSESIYGSPAGLGMKILKVPDVSPYPMAEIGTKEQLYRSLLNGKCVPASCVKGGYEFISMGRGRKKQLLDEYFGKMPDGMYVLLSTDWD